MMRFRKQYGTEDTVEVTLHPRHDQFPLARDYERIMATYSDEQRADLALLLELTHGVLQQSYYHKN